MAETAEIQLCTVSIVGRSYVTRLSHRSIYGASLWSVGSSSGVSAELLSSYMHRSCFLQGWARPSFRRNLALAAVSSGALCFGLTRRHADSSAPTHAIPKTPFSALVRAYTVYSMCSIPSLVDYSPQILRILTTVPVVRQITEAFVRVTFFNQVRLSFVGIVCICANNLSNVSSWVEIACGIQYPCYMHSVQETKVPY